MPLTEFDSKVTTCWFEDYAADKRGCGNGGRRRSRCGIRPPNGEVVRQLEVWPVTQSRNDSGTVRSYIPAGGESATALSIIYSHMRSRE